MRSSKPTAQATHQQSSGAFAAQLAASGLEDVLDKSCDLGIEDDSDSGSLLFCTRAGGRPTLDSSSTVDAVADDDADDF